MLSSLAAESPGPWRSCAARFAPTSHCCPPPDDPGTGVRPTCSACGIMNRSHVRVNQVSGCSLYCCTPTEQVSNLSMLSLSRWPRNWWLSSVLFLSHHEQFTVLGWTHSMGTQSTVLTKHATNHSLLWSLSHPRVTVYPLYCHIINSWQC